MSEHSENRTTQDLARRSDGSTTDHAVDLVDEISLRDIWQALVRRKKIIFLITALTTLGASLYLFLATPIYRAEVLMVSESDQQDMPGSLSALASQFAGTAALAGFDLNGNDGGDVEVALAILQSRSFTEQYIKEQNLMPILFSDRWNQQKGEWKTPGTFARAMSAITDLISRQAGAGIDRVRPTAWDAYDLVREEILSVEEDKPTGLITLSIDWRDPELATEWANNAVARVNDHIRRDDVIQAEKSIRFLNKQLAETMPIEVEQALYGLIREQTKVIMLADAREEYVFKVIDPAVVPQTSIRPRRTLIISFGIFLGLTLGALIAVSGNTVKQSA